MKKQVPVWIILAAICIVAAGLLALTNGITKDTIAQNELDAVNATRRELVPAAATFEETEEGVYIGRDASGNAVGYVITVPTQGFGGEIEITVATDDQGTINGISIGGSNFSETPGLGARSKEPAFQSQFAGKVYPVELSKNGGEIDAITSATITSSAVIRGTNAALEKIAAKAGFELAKEETAIEELGDRTYATSVKGFGGPVYVQLTLDENNVITAIQIGDASFNETNGLGAKAKDESFWGQYIGKSGQLALGTDIDAISGATITSSAVTDAVNQILLYVSDPEAFAASQAPSYQNEYAVRTDKGLYVTGTARGFGGTVRVFLTADDDGKIAALTIGDNEFAETPGLGARALEPEFAAQFIGKSLPVAITDIDALTGATITTNAVIEALNTAYSEIGHIPEIAQDQLPEQPEEQTTEQVPEQTTEQTVEQPAIEGTVITGKAQGFGGPVAVNVTLDADNKIVKLEIGDAGFAETPGLGARALEPEFAAQFTGKSLPITINDIDALTSATITTNAVIDAINAAYSEIVPAVEETVEQPAIEGTVITGKAQGFGGPVAVNVTLDADNRIVKLEIGDAEFAETPGLGARALEPGFAAQFTGKSLPITINDIDALTGATITTNAVIDAINAAYSEIAPAVEETAEQPAIEGTVITGKAQGFGGPVAVNVTLDADNRIVKLKIGDAEFAETPGLGARALEPEFAAQFTGKSLPITINDIDALTSATITTNAVIDAINAAYSEIAPAVEETVEQPAIEGTVITGKAQGFGGPVAVNVTLDADNKIVKLEIGDAEFAETPGLGARALEPEFAAQFAGKSLPITINDIDALTGATITTNAVIDAINAAYSEIAPAVEETAEQPAIEGTVIIGKAQGFGGPVAVNVTLDADNRIVKLEIGDAEFAETPGLGARALEPGFAAQFTGKSLPITINDIDALTGATVTTNAVIDAINAAYSEIAPAIEGTVITGKAQGFGGPVAVNVTLDADNRIVKLEIGDAEFAETPGLGARALEPGFAAQFTGKSLPITINDIDALTGATITTNAVIDAVNAAYSEIAPAAEGTVITGKAQGFGGPVAVNVTLDADNRIVKLEIGDAEFAETPGLGARALEPEFAAQFAGKSLPITINDIDALTGATITTNAVIDAINAAYSEIAPAAEGTVITGKAQGFGGPVAVNVTLDADNKIVKLEIGDAEFAETPGLGARALEPEFAAQFTGKSLPITINDIDALTGATITTNAVIDAINTAFETQK